MEITLMPKDVGRAITLKDVVYYFFAYDVLHVWFKNGHLREYPACHVWYVESLKG